MTICRARITLKNGTVLYARDFGKRAFCWEVSDKETDEQNESDATVQGDAAES